jgi:hypothetical protein
MVRLSYNITINAPVEIVWDTMLSDSTYRAWTKTFNEGSFYEGNWAKNSEMLFIGFDEQGLKQGIFSRIKDNQLHKFISIEHIGLIKNGEKDTEDSEIEQWKGALENYRFESTSDKETILTIETDTIDSFIDYFDDAWPKALNVLKQLAEVRK